MEQPTCVQPGPSAMPPIRPCVYCKASATAIWNHRTAKRQNCKGAELQRCGHMDLQRGKNAKRGVGQQWCDSGNISETACSALDILVSTRRESLRVLGRRSTSTRQMRMSKRNRVVCSAQHEISANMAGLAGDHHIHTPQVQ